MIKRDALTPASAQDYATRLGDVARELDRADSALYNAWAERNDARWPRHSTSLKDMRPSDDPLVLAAEAKVEVARDAWRAAHAKLVAFVSAPLELRCGVVDWVPNRGRQRCGLPSDHDCPHTFEPQPEKRA